MRIQHNMRAANANRVLKNNNLSRVKATEKLSSGYRINRAGDDAAGLAISEKMRSQIRGLNQASRNVEDGISYVQVADGSLEEVQQMLHRIHELSVQAANGTNVQEDRLHIDSEVQQLKKEISSIFAETEFNTKKIWVGEPHLVDVIVGTTTINGMSVPQTSIYSRVTDTNKEAFPRSGVRISADSSGMIFSWTGYNGNAYSTEVVPWEQDPTGTHLINLKDYMDTTAYPELTGINFQYGYTAHSDAQLTDIIRALNGRSLSGSDSISETTVNVGSVSGRVSSSAYIDYTAELAAGESFDITDNTFLEGLKVGGAYSNVTPRQNDSDPLVFTFDMRNVGEVKAVFSDTYYSSSNRDPAGENLWWEYYTSGGVQRQRGLNYYLSNDNGSLQDLFYALDGAGNTSLKSPTCPVDGTVTMRFDLRATTPFTTTYGTTTDYVGYMYVRFNLKSTDSRDDVRAVFDSLKGLDINPTGTPQYRIYNSAVANAGDIVTHTYGYDYEYRGNLTIQAGANGGQILSMDYPVMTNEYLGIESLRVDTQEEAEKAITTSQEAVQVVSKVRSLFGAFQNRLEHTLEYNKNASQNLQEAESRLRDADMAKEMMELSKDNILAEMGQKVLSMANSDSESVLNLLRG